MLSGISREKATANASKVTPLRRQYLDIKRQHPDAVLFFRLGDFYEMFDRDAELVAEALHIVLTSREFGRGGRVPMCGVPHHSAPTYIARLIEAGHRVAVCDQISEPGEGLVERKVTRVITPGTVIEEEMLRPEANNYLATVVVDGNDFGLSYADVSTGEFAATELDRPALVRELARVGARETLLFGAECGALEISSITEAPIWLAEPSTSKETLLRHFAIPSLEGLGLNGLPLAARAAGALVGYLEEVDASSLHVLTGVHVYSSHGYMELDAFTRTNLELETAGREGRSEGSLLSVLDRTTSPMGSRLLRQRLGRPSLDITKLNARLDQVASLVENPSMRKDLRVRMATVGDLERLANRLMRRSARTVDLRHLRVALATIQSLRDALNDEMPSLHQLASRLDPCEEAADLIDRSITESGERAIQAGYSDELDRVSKNAAEAKAWIVDLERKERHRTGVKGLKVGYNRVFGYYIEVGRTHSESVPADYQRRQTLVNTERYVTQDLKEYEALVLSAEERIADLEHVLFSEVIEHLSQFVSPMLSTATAVAELDVSAALADVAERNRYTRPELTDTGSLEIEGGRHPVVEAVQTDGFVPNDTHLDLDGQQIMVLTGPNMAGKSTYLRQVALIVLLAQIGSFVPANRAHICIVDRIFTRVGAHDDLAAGSSTFMVEMLELAAILAQATPRSLLILDEIGRGTSTYDGISVARAVLEHLHNHPRLRAKTIFATHYYELTAVANLLPRVHNFNASVAEQEGQLVFLRRILPGGADRSYGVHVAELAGLPPTVIRRASEILRELEQSSRNGTTEGLAQLTLLPPETHPLVEKLRALDVDQLTPLDALTTLYELHRSADR